MFCVNYPSLSDTASYTPIESYSTLFVDDDGPPYEQELSIMDDILPILPNEDKPQQESVLYDNYDCTSSLPPYSNCKPILNFNPANVKCKEEPLFSIPTSTSDDNNVDSDEYIPDVTPNSEKSHKKVASRIRGHNIGREMRFRIGQLMIGFKNRYPRKTKKEIASLISKRLSIEYP